MAEKVQLAAKTSKAKENSASKTRKIESPQSMSSPADQVLYLQRTIGNQAVQRLIKSGALQAKLKIGQSGDKYEQEADRVADAVMRMPGPQVQRQVEPEEEEEETLQSKPLVGQITPLVQVQCQEETEEEEETLQVKPLAEEITPLVQRQVEPEEGGEELQAKATSGRSPEVNSNLESHIQSLKGCGQPLPESMRAFYESRFVTDFSGVRVHTGSDAAETAKSINARAFTVRENIAFGAGQFVPGSHEGRKLLAHELTHVVQQAETVQTKAARVQPLIVNILPRYVNNKVQRNDDPEKDILPNPLAVNWGGDPLRIEFRRINEDGSRFEFVIHYQGPHPVSGPFIENKTKLVSTMIGSAKLNARVLRQTNTLIEVDLYSDGSRVVKLTDTVTFDSRSTSKGRQHDFNVMVLGRSVYASSFWVLDPKAKSSDIPTTQPEERPGENPSSRLISDWLTTEIRIDGDGDQYKELLLHIRAKSFWSDVNSFSPGVTQMDAAKTVLLQIEQISTKQVREVTFDLPKPSISGSLFPIVEEVTDGFGPTQISLVLPTRTQWIEIYPPERTPQDVKYLVVAARNRFSFRFPPEKSEIHKVVAPGDASVIGNIVSADIALGAYRDKFRFTVQPKTNDQAVLGISPLYKGEPLGGVGADLKINGQIRFQVLLTGDVSLGIDLHGDKKPDLMIYDQLTTPQEVDGGGPPEKNRNHRIRVVGEAVGGEKKFYFQVRYGTLMPTLGRSIADKAAISNAQAVSGLKQQAAEGTFEKQLDAYESALMAERKKAADTGLIRMATFDAWAALSLAMIKLRPQITKTVDAILQGEAVKQAEAFYKSLADETKYKWKSVAATEYSSTSENPYTDEMTTIAPFYSRTMGAGPELSGDIKAGRWSKALANYQRLVSGLDQWILDRLKAVKGEHSVEAQRVGLLAGHKRELGKIEKHNPKRILAVFHPNEKFKGEQGYVTEFPLALYYWKEGNTWHLKDITNPEKTYDYTVSAADREQEPPLKLLGELNDPDHFPVGVIHYDIPNKYAGEIRTKDYLTWKKFFTYLGLGLAAVGLTLATFGTGTVAVAGSWVLAGSALAGATSATIDLIERGQQGNLDATTAIIDIAQIVGSLAGASALASGRIVQAAANAPAGSRWAGNWARLAMFANKLYVPMVGTTAAADVVSFAVIAQDTAKQLDEIENGPGDRASIDRAKALLLSQLAVMGGLTALSVKGTIPEFTKGRTLVLHPGPDGVPVVSTALTRKSVIIDTNTAIALDKKARGVKLQQGEEAMVKKIEAMGDIELRVADVTVAERELKGKKVMYPGIAVNVDRTGKEYQNILEVLTDKNVGGAKGVADRTILADTFFAVPEPGVKPTFVTHDPGIYNKMARITGYEPAKALPVPQKFPNGFDVTINDRTIKVIPVHKTKK